MCPYPGSEVCLCVYDDIDRNALVLFNLSWQSLKQEGSETADFPESSFQKPLLCASSPLVSHCRGGDTQGPSLSSPLRGRWWPSKPGICVCEPSVCVLAEAWSSQGRGGLQGSSLIGSGPEEPLFPVAAAEGGRKLGCGKLAWSVRMGKTWTRQQWWFRRRRHTC